MTAVLIWIAAAFTRCWHWLKQVSQRGLAALMLLLMPVSLGLLAAQRTLSPTSVDASLLTTRTVPPETRVEDWPVQEEDRRGNMVERRTGPLRSELIWNADVSESGTILLPTMLAQMGNSAEWPYQTLVPGLALVPGLVSLPENQTV